MTNTTVQTSLNAVLADYQIFYQKLRNYHWNITGQHFFVLHEKFEELYIEVADRIDEVAERILKAGSRPLSTYQSYLDTAELKEDAGIPEASVMVSNIADDLAALNQKLRKVVEQAQEANDIASANLLEDYADAQEKTVWMLRAFLG